MRDAPEPRLRGGDDPGGSAPASGGVSARTAKPRLIFFRPIWPGVPPYIRAQLNQQVACLEKSFTVKVIPGSCDFDRECSVFEPDMAMFESGAYAQERDYANIGSHRHLPRLGFLNADAYCPTRSVFISDMDRWGVSDFVTLSVSMAEYFPSIADRLFVWANCIDRTLFDLPPLEKNIAALFIGSEATHYPWRIGVHEQVASAMATLTVPRHGWNVQTASMPQGRDYSRLIAESWFVPSCGTIARDVVRKHFEIPAAGACLVTERTAALEEAGFEDMVNCVFADADTVVDKLTCLKSDPERLEAVIEAGRALVIGRHCQENRGQVLQWFRLQGTLGPGQTIVQRGPFCDLQRSTVSRASNRHVVSGGIDRALLSEGYAALERGRLASAETLFLRCLNYHPMPEALRGLALAALKRGDPARAREWIAGSIERMRTVHLAVDSDPVEWSLMMRVALCQGDIAGAAAHAGSFPWVHHIELDRLKAVLGCLGASRDAVEPAGATDRPSVHDPFLTISPQRWFDDLVSDLACCGATDIAERLSRNRHSIPGRPVSPALRRNGTLPRDIAAAAKSVRRRNLIAALKSRMRKVQRRIAGPDRFCRELTALAATMGLETALICGKDPGGDLILAIVRGSDRNPGGPLSVRSVADSARKDGISIGGSAAAQPGQGGNRHALVVAAQQTDIDPCWLDQAMPYVVAIEATEAAAGSRLLRHLRDSPAYALVRLGRDRRGFAIFRRTVSPRDSRPAHTSGPPLGLQGGTTS